LPEQAYYLSLDAARDAIRRGSQFNIIDMATGWKADLILLKQREFSRSEFQRRVAAKVFGVDVWLELPEGDGRVGIEGGAGDNSPAPTD
jgi:hypothetical protein